MHFRTMAGNHLDPQYKLLRQRFAQHERAYGEALPLLRNLDNYETVDGIFKEVSIVYGMLVSTHLNGRLMSPDLMEIMQEKIQRANEKFVKLEGDLAPESLKGCIETVQEFMAPSVQDV